MRKRRGAFRASDLVHATSPTVMRCVECGHEQVHQGPRGVKHCDRWMAPVNRLPPTTN